VKRGWGPGVLAALVLAASAGLLVYEAWADSLTYDEPRYMRAGYCALTQGVIDIEPTNPAGFKLLSGIGVLAARPPGAVDCATTNRVAFFNLSPSALRRLVVAGRLPIIVITLLLELGVFLWARALYGAAAGVLALGAAALEPNLLAHGHLATGDMLVSAGTLAALGGVWAHRRRAEPGWLVVAGVGLGLALLAKVSALLLLPVLAIIVALDSGALHRGRVFGLSQLAAVAAVAWLVVCGVYLPFHTEHTPLQLPALIAPFAPPSWVSGVEYQAGHLAGGAHNYLNGEVRVGRGFLTYYLEAVGLKSTLGLLLLGAAAAALGLRRRDRVAALYLWLPALTLFAAASLGAIDIGVRYVLPAYPLAALAAGGLWADGRRARTRALAAVAVALLAASSLLHAPYHLGYFNELAGPRPERYLADSNLDWGQDAWRLRDRWAAEGSPALQAVYFGSVPLAAYGIAASPAGCDCPSGAEAVSLTQLVVYGTERGFGKGLLACDPGLRVGTSILWLGARDRACAGDNLGRSQAAAPVR